MASAHNLSREDIERLDRLVATGDYPSREAVVAASLDSLERDRERWHAMVAAKIAEGRADAAAGRVRPMNDVFDDLEKRLAEL